MDDLFSLVFLFFFFFVFSSVVSIRIHNTLFLNVFMQDSPDPLANSLLQPQFPGTLVLELDWLPLRTEKTDPLVLCIAGADSSFRLVEVNMYVAEFILNL